MTSSGGAAGSRTLRRRIHDVGIDTSLIRFVKTNARSEHDEELVAKEHARR